MADSSIWVIMAFLGVAAFVQSATGFGLALVTMAGLPLVMTVRDASTLTAILNLVVCTGVIFANRHGFEVKKFWPYILAICIGIPIGYYGLRSMSDLWVKRSLGFILVGLAIWEVFFRKEGIKMTKHAGLPICLSGGVLGGAFNVGGPPIVAYIYSQNWSKVQSIAAIQTIFLASGLMRNTFMVIEGDTTFGILKLLAFSLPAVALGIWLGKIVLDRTPISWLKRVVFIAVFGIGCFYIWTSFR